MNRYFSHVPKNETVWKGLRKHDVTSTESAALFGLSPYMSKFELYHRKKNKDITDIQMNDRMLWGQRMQNIIAEGIGADNGVIVRPVPEYMRIVQSRMGASFDFEIVGIAGELTADQHVNPGGRSVLQDYFINYGPGLFEIKATGYVEFRDNWTKNDDRSIEAPGHIEIQLQHQLHVAEFYKWGAIGVLVAGNTQKVTARLRDREVGEGLEAAIVQLWDDIKHGREPDPSYPDDASLVKTLYSRIAEGSLFDGREDAELEALCEDYSLQLSNEGTAKGLKETAASKIAKRLDVCQRGITQSFNISRWITAEAEVPAYTRKSFPGMKITRKKAK